jgi:hypothetical protein
VVAIGEEKTREPWVSELPVGAARRFDVSKYIQYWCSANERVRNRISLEMTVVACGKKDFHPVVFFVVQPNAQVVERRRGRAEVMVRQ